MGSKFSAGPTNGRLRWNRSDQQDARAFGSGWLPCPAGVALRNAQDLWILPCPLLVEPGLQERLGESELPHDALVRDAALLQELLNLLLGIIPGQSAPIAAFQVLERAFAVQLWDRERGLLVHKAWGNEIFARHTRILLNRSNRVDVGTAQNSRQILPKWAPDSSYRNASAISASPKLRSITGGHLGQLKPLKPTG
jgi:hypothetical protein